jgi:hypothetical protein
VKDFACFGVPIFNPWELPQSKRGG